MGRRNNARAQAAAAALKSTPARARFSKGPPNARNNTRGSKHRDGGGCGSADSCRGGTSNKNQTNAGGRGRVGGGVERDTAAAGRVIDKIQNRVQRQVQDKQTQQPAGRIATAAEALQHVDASKLDEIAISSSTQDLISKLLEDLGILSTGNTIERTPPLSSRGGTSIQEEDYEEMELYDPVLEASSARRQVAITDYSLMNSHGRDDDIYNDDFDETYYDDDGPRVAEWKKSESDDDNQNDDSGSASGSVDRNYGVRSVDDDDDNDEISDGENLEENKTFVHLTQELSFTHDQARRACQAIDGWEGLGTQPPGDNMVKITSSEGKALASSDNINEASDEKLQEIAMDWLCLHLTEEDLKKGFRPNPHPPIKSVQPKKSTNLTIKPIAHPSISVISNPLLEAKEWARSLMLQERALAFTRLGFHHSDAIEACEATALEVSKEHSVSQRPEIPLDDPAIVLLMEGLCDEALRDVCMDSLPGCDKKASSLIDDVAEERRNEVEALQAIYDDQLEILYKDDEARADAIRSLERSSPIGASRYCLKILPSEELQAPASASQCKLFVFLREGYPITQIPLFLLVCPGLPPSLLRRINVKLYQKAFQMIGTPVVFEIVSFIGDSVTEWQKEFMQEQRRKEFDAEQTRLLRQRDGLVKKFGNVVATQYAFADSGGRLGRRQRAKLKAAAKAYDRPDHMAQLEEERKRRQAARVADVKYQNSQIRSQYAQDAIMKREQQRIEEEAERSARIAMNAAYNSGKSPQEARAAAELKRQEVFQYHLGGEDNIEEDKENPEDLPIDKSPIDPTDSEAHVSEVSDNVMVSSASESLPTKSGPTQTTSAFMDRLREMYEKAAKKKSGSHKPAKGDDDDEKLDASSGDELSSPSQLEGYHLDTSISLRKDEVDHIPRPVAVPGGELASVMKDIIAQQEDQPWLIAPEARVPTIDLHRTQVSQKKAKLETSINRTLQTELVRKRREAFEWGQRNGNKAAQTKRAKQKNNGFSPQQFYSMMCARERLPAYQKAEDIVATINANQVTVIAGETGCGKTTQVPQLVLDHLIEMGCGAAANIIVTQPRRISAIGVSERIAEERCEKVGDTCGYSIKLERKTSNKTRLLLCTTGVLLRRLQVDPDLASVSHIFVDEVHERDLNTDFLIIILRDLLSRRPNLKLVLMSATLNAESFKSYFGDNTPIVSISGRAHPVQENRLEDILELTGYQIEEGSDYAVKTSDSQPPKISKSTLRRLYHPRYSKATIHSLSIIDETVICYPLLAELLENISINQDDGAILVFVPGYAEIQKTIEELYKKEYFQSSKATILPLHSSLSTAEQTAIFEVSPPGVRKIVVSTNIAETSITIEDVVFVVDTGRVKENRRDEVNETPTLVECWVSKASAKQRRGRAGRVRPGIAYHLYSSHTHDTELMEYQLPEMLRVGIEDLVLQILVLDLGEPTTFLRKALDPPSNLALSNSLRLLEQLGAVDVKWQSNRLPTGNIDEKGELQARSELTALGFHLAAIPVDPRVGKCLIYASLFGCVDPLLTLAATMSSRSPFLSPFDQRDQADEARKNFAIDGSDHLTILNAFDQWTKLRQNGKGNQVVNAFLKDNFLGRLTLHQIEDLRKQYHALLVQIGFLPSSFRLNDKDHPANAHAKNMGLVKAVLCAGLYPGVVVGPRDVTSSDSKTKVGEKSFRSRTKGDVYLHPSTIAFDLTSLSSRYCCYHELVRTSKTYVRDCTPISPIALILFGGGLNVNQTVSICSIDGWLKFRIAAKPATLMKYLRGKMEQVLFEKIVNPDKDVMESSDGKAVIESICLLFEAESKMRPDRSGASIVRPWTGQEAEERNAMDMDRSRRGGGRGREGRGRGRGRQGGRGRSRQQAS